MALADLALERRSAGRLSRGRRRSADELRRDVTALEVGDDVPAVVGVERSDRRHGVRRLVVEPELGGGGGDGDVAVENLGRVDPAGLGQRLGEAAVGVVVEEEADAVAAGLRRVAWRRIPRAAAPRRPSGRAWHSAGRGRRGSSCRSDSARGPPPAPRGRRRRRRRTSGRGRGRSAPSWSSARVRPRGRRARAPARAGRGRDRRSGGGSGRRWNRPATGRQAPRRSRAPSPPRARGRREPPRSSRGRRSASRRRTAGPPRSCRASRAPCPSASRARSLWIAP